MLVYILINHFLCFTRPFYSYQKHGARRNQINAVNCENHLCFARSYRSSSVYLHEWKVAKVTATVEYSIQCSVCYYSKHYSNPVSVAQRASASEPGWPFSNDFTNATWYGKLFHFHSRQTFPLHYNRVWSDRPKQTQNIKRQCCDRFVNTRNYNQFSEHCWTKHTDTTPLIGSTGDEALEL